MAVVHLPLPNLLFMVIFVSLLLGVVDILSSSSSASPSERVDYRVRNASAVQSVLLFSSVVPSEGLSVEHGLAVGWPIPVR